MGYKEAKIWHGDCFYYPLATMDKRIMVNLKVNHVNHVRPTGLCKTSVSQGYHAIRTLWKWVIKGLFHTVQNEGQARLILDIELSRECIYVNFQSSKELTNGESWHLRLHPKFHFQEALWEIQGVSFANIIMYRWYANLVIPWGVRTTTSWLPAASANFEHADY